MKVLIDPSNGALLRFVGLLLCSLGIALLLVVWLARASAVRVRMTPQGIVIHRGRRTYTYAWADLEPFEVLQDTDVPIVASNLRAPAVARLGHRTIRFSEDFGMPPTALAFLFNEARALPCGALSGRVTSSVKCNSQPS